ncbi:unnamed protein product [Caenorhabditis auriculariae]|uniref:Uncharacterized protein n=1 Tax=Caenorhabditis auriculariae TaxID=2777116 RepID=A0A8S1HIY6_9PELO|nr:unnamed protein product [Caenorhabditis auriculariae]
MSWQSTCYFVEGIVSIPLYLRILFLLWQFRKKFITYKSPYYTLILSQGVMDILSWFLFAILIVGRQIRPIGEVLFAVDHYKVAWMINSQATFLLISRAVGVALISIQKIFGYLQPEFQGCLDFHRPAPLAMDLSSLFRANYYFSAYY